MESIGEKLKTARKEKGYSLDQVSRETHIAKRFVEALEEEDFDAFPGEPYLIGFLKTYSIFLDLDPQEMVNLYKSFKLQEQPAPIDELIVAKRPLPWVPVVAVASALLLLGLGVLFLARSGVFRRSRDDAAAVDVQSAGDTYPLADEILERRFQEGDVIVIPVRDERYPVTLARVGEEALLELPAGSVTIPEDREEILDLNSDGTGDVRVIVRELTPSDNPPTLVLRFDRVVQSPTGGGGVAETPASELTDTPAIGSTTVPERERVSVRILEADAPEPFSVEIEFRGFSLFRYDVDGEEQDQRYLQNGDTFRTTADRNFQFWLSNAGAASVRVSGEELDIGEPGEVTVGMVRWTNNPTGRGSRLELIPV
ncbi:MAG: RodZ domain-containing protein, partial [Spirochaetaceae bacterium]